MVVLKGCGLHGGAGPPPGRPPVPGGEDVGTEGGLGWALPTPSDDGEALAAGIGDKIRDTAEVLKGKVTEAAGRAMATRSPPRAT